MAPAKASKKKQALTGSKNKAADVDAKKRKKPSAHHFAMYINRVLKQVHPDSGISKKSMMIMSSFINDVFEKLSAESGRLTKYSKK